MFKWKECKHLELQITQTWYPLSVADGQTCLSSAPLKNEKKIWNVHKLRGAHFQYVNNHKAKFEWKQMKTFWSYRLNKLSTPKVLQKDRRTDGRTDRRSGPTTRPAFAKATQVKSKKASIANS